MKSIPRARVLRILEDHNISSFNQQTGSLNGNTVESGTSFDEQIGVKEFYSLNEVRNWLGY